MLTSKRLLALVAAGALALPACGAFETAAAVVDGAKIENEEFVQRVDFVLAGPQFTDLPAGGEGERQREEVVRQLLTFLIHQKLIDGYALENDLEVDPQQLDALFDQQIEQLGGEESFRRQLADSGLTQAEVRELVGAQLLRQSVAERVVAEEIPEEELRADYEARLPEFATVDVAHILVDDRARAQQIFEDATPENFAELAARFSKDPGSAESGGELGERPAADFVGPFAQATLEIPVGEIGAPVRTQFGFHVIWVKAREVTPFEEARDQLIGERSGDVFVEWLLEQARGAEIRVNPRYGVYDDDAGQVVPRTATTPEPGPQVTP